MAPNLPTLVQLGLVKGDPNNGLLPSGQVAAVIDQLESCEELIHRIVREASERISALPGKVEGKMK
jgi:nitronate monooxygenase